jgi:alanine-glyoxylate transaminase/serine-glyoxylate transaminase/serine-pyruvate transaminase
MVGADELLQNVPLPPTISPLDTEQPRFEEEAGVPVRDEQVRPGELAPPARILLGPGPCNVHPRVLRALQAPIVGHLDPAYTAVMDETQALLRRVFQTANEVTLPISGTGFAGAEAALANLVEPGDRVVVCVNGFFGERMAGIARRCGAEVHTVHAEWGRIIEPDDVRRALQAGPTRAVTIVLGETSTGVLQPIDEIARIVHEHEALFVVDAVTPLGGHSVTVDAWQVDICHSCSQKCLGCVPGLAPITASERAMRRIRARRRPVQSFYYDLSELMRYWGPERFYHHTSPILLVYALREALRLIDEEGLEPRFRRHCLNGEALQAGLEAMGLRLVAQEGHRMKVLTTVYLPDDIDEAAVRGALLNEFNIEVGGGLGALKGRILRIGLMGASSTRANVLLVLSALEEVLRRQGYRCPPGAGLQAAQAVFAR